MGGEVAHNVTLAEVSVSCTELSLLTQPLFCTYAPTTKDGGVCKMDSTEFAFARRWPINGRNVEPANE